MRKYFTFRKPVLPSIQQKLSSITVWFFWSIAVVQSTPSSPFCRSIPVKAVTELRSDPLLSHSNLASIQSVPVSLRPPFARINLWRCLLQHPSTTFWDWAEMLSSFFTIEVGLWCAVIGLGTDRLERIRTHKNVWRLAQNMFWVGGMSSRGNLLWFH